MLNEFKCLDCGTIIKTELKNPEKCSCGGTKLVSNFLNKRALFNLLNQPEETKEHLFEKKFLQEDIEEEEEVKKLLLRCYEDICFIIEKYLDIEDRHKKIIALWVIGTYFHDNFNSFPYLYLNAMKGSGKTRLMNLIGAMAWEGSVQNSLTEAVLFRTKGTLCIDEFERGGRRGSENLLELLNSAYKKGTKVRRMKKKKTNEGEEHVIEEYEMFRPIVIANITGLDNVLQDRCIKIVLEKSINLKKTRLIENLLEEKIYSVKRIINSIIANRCSLCSVVTPQEVYILWNSYVLEQGYTHNYTSTLTTLTTLTTLKTLINKFESVQKTSLNGRDLELSLPLLIVAMWIDGAYGMEGFFNEHLEILDKIFEEKKQEESIENIDYSLYDFLSTQLEVQHFQQVKEITDKFREFLQTSDEWLNSRWMGRALNRLNLVLEKRRLSRGVEVKIDYKKAKEKANIFK